MPESNGKPPKIPQIIAGIRRDSSEPGAQSSQANALGAGLARLREWQSRRLAQTYSDFLESKRFGPACQFFLDQLYGPFDVSQRNHDFEQLYERLARVLPPVSLELLRRSIELNRLSDELDARLLHALESSVKSEGEITPDQYAAGYRMCDNYAERIFQIELLVAVLDEVTAGVRLPLVGPTLRLTRLPARQAGWGEVHTFLEQGHGAFRQMGRYANLFTGAIEEREKLILDRIYSAHPDPFSILDSPPNRLID